MVKLKGLGRGLDALLAGDMENATSGESLKNLSLDELQPGKYQPRSYMDQESLASLADSIKSQGIMQPIVARQLASGSYEIIAGERRWRAARLAGLSEVPVILKEIPDEAALAMALIENIQRENLNPLEESNGIRRLIDEFQMTHEAAAKAVGRSRSAVTNLLRLQNLHANVQEMLMSGKLDMGHARALLTLPEAKQITVAEHIAQKHLSVREAEQLVRRLLDQPQQRIEKPHDRDVANLQESLADALGAKVEIKSGSKGGGYVKIHYANLDQLDDFLGRLKISR